MTPVSNTPAPGSPATNPPRGLAPYARLAPAALWMLAGVLLAIVFLGDSSASQPIVGLTGAARAGMVASSGSYTMLTVESGNEDMLVVLDSRNENLMVYRSTPQEGVQLLQRHSLPQIFGDAKSRWMGRNK